MTKSEAIRQKVIRPTPALCDLISASLLEVWVIVMNIAIVDDEPGELYSARTYLRKYIREAWADFEADINIQMFSCAKDLLKTFKPGMYQLVILDICMPEINGMQAAQIIRARGDNEVQIVFLTANDDFVFNGYRVFAVGYFMKPITNHATEFAKTFEHIFPKLCKKNPELFLSVDGSELAVPYRNILYVDINEHHKLCVHLVDSVVATANSYAEVWEILSEDERFLECYHRIIMNMDYVKLMKEDDFILLDDTLIPISQRKKKDVKVKYMHYFAHK